MSKIVLYKCNCDRKKVNKMDSVDVIATVTGMRIKDASSIFNPEIILSKSSVGDQYPYVNYAYIPKWGRYYFVDDIIEENDGILSFTLSVDVLNTYSEQILTTPQWVVRSEKINSKRFIDTERPIQSNKLLSSYIIGAIPESIGQNTNNYYLTVAGG